MNYFLEKLKYRASPKNILYGFLFIAFVNLVAFPLFPRLFGDATTVPIQKILDLQFGFSEAYVKGLLEMLGNDGRRVYLFSTLLVDTPYALVYGFVYAFLVLFLIEKIRKKARPFHPRWDFLACLPFGISIFDLFENAGTTYFLLSYPNLSSGFSSFAVFLSSLSNQLKWSFAALTVAAVLMLLGLLAFRGRQAG